MFVYKHAKDTEDDDGQILEIVIDKAYTNTSLDDNSLDELVYKVARILWCIKVYVLFRPYNVV